jgi:hypothetical protein
MWRGTVCNGLRERVQGSRSLLGNGGGDAAVQGAIWLRVDRL